MIRADVKLLAKEHRSPASEMTTDRREERGWILKFDGSDVIGWSELEKYGTVG